MSKKNNIEKPDGEAEEKKQKWMVDGYTRDAYVKEFMKTVASLSDAHSQADMFKDAVRFMMLHWLGPILKNTFRNEQLERCEEENKAILAKYGGERAFHIFAKLMALTIEYLERFREEFLGHVLECYNATNKHTAQFLTPPSVAKVMAMCQVEGVYKKYKEDVDKGIDRIIRINDPACGASVLLIEQAKVLMEQGVRQCDIMLYAEDLDATAFNITYLELSILGFAARVTKMNSLTEEIFEGPYYTIGYYAHNMVLRREGYRAKVEGHEPKPSAEESKAAEEPSAPKEDAKDEKPTEEAHVEETPTAEACEKVPDMSKGVQMTLF